MHPREPRSGNTRDSVAKKLIKMKEKRTKKGKGKNKELRSRAMFQDLTTFDDNDNDDSDSDRSDDGGGHMVNKPVDEWQHNDYEAFLLQDERFLVDPTSFLETMDFLDIGLRKQYKTLFTAGDEEAHQEANFISKQQAQNQISKLVARHAALQEILQLKLQSLSEDSQHRIHEEQNQSPESAYIFREATRIQQSERFAKQFSRMTRGDLTDDEELNFVPTSTDLYQGYTKETWKSKKYGLDDFQRDFERVTRVDMTYDQINEMYVHAKKNDSNRLGSLKPRNDADEIKQQNRFTKRQLDKRFLKAPPLQNDDDDDDLQHDSLLEKIHQELRQLQRHIYSLVTQYSSPNQNRHFGGSATGRQKLHPNDEFAKTFHTNFSRHIHYLQQERPHLRPDQVEDANKADEETRQRIKHFSKLDPTKAKLPLIARATFTYQYPVKINKPTMREQLTTKLTQIRQVIRNYEQEAMVSTFNPNPPHSETFSKLRATFDPLSAVVFGGQGGQSAVTPNLWGELIMLADEHVDDEAGSGRVVLHENQTMTPEPDIEKFLARLPNDRQLMDQDRLLSNNIYSKAAIHIINTYNIDLHYLQQHNPTLLTVNISHDNVRLNWLKLLCTSIGIDVELISKDNIWKQYEFDIYHDVTAQHKKSQKAAQHAQIDYKKLHQAQQYNPFSSANLSSGSSESFQRMMSVFTEKGRQNPSQIANYLPDASHLHISQRNARLYGGSHVQLDDGNVVVDMGQSIDNSNLYGQTQHFSTDHILKMAHYTQKNWLRSHLRNIRDDLEPLLALSQSNSGTINMIYQLLDSQQNILTFFGPDSFDIDAMQEEQEEHEHDIIARQREIKIGRNIERRIKRSQFREDAKLRAEIKMLKKRAKMREIAQQNTMLDKLDIDVEALENDDETDGEDNYDFISDDDNDNNHDQSQPVEEFKNTTTQARQKQRQKRRLLRRKLLNQNDKDIEEITKWVHSDNEVIDLSDPDSDILVLLDLTREEYHNHRKVRFDEAMEDLDELDFTDTSDPDDYKLSEDDLDDKNDGKNSLQNDLSNKDPKLLTPEDHKELHRQRIAKLRKKRRDEREKKQKALFERPRVSTTVPVLEKTPPKPGKKHGTYRYLYKNDPYSFSLFMNRFTLSDLDETRIKFHTLDESLPFDSIHDLVPDRNVIRYYDAGVGVLSLTYFQQLSVFVHQLAQYGYMNEKRLNALNTTNPYRFLQEEHERLEKMSIDPLELNPKDKELREEEAKAKAEEESKNPKKSKNGDLYDDNRVHRPIFQNIKQLALHEELNWLFPDISDPPTQAQAQENHARVIDAPHYNIANYTPPPRSFVDENDVGPADLFSAQKRTLYAGHSLGEITALASLTLNFNHLINVRPLMMVKQMQSHEPQQFDFSGTTTANIEMTNNSTHHLMNINNDLPIVSRKFKPIVNPYPDQLQRHGIDINKLSWNDISVTDDGVFTHTKTGAVLDPLKFSHNMKLKAPMQYLDWLEQLESRAQEGPNGQMIGPAQGFDENNLPSDKVELYTRSGMLLDNNKKGSWGHTSQQHQTYYHLKKTLRYGGNSNNPEMFADPKNGFAKMNQHFDPNSKGGEEDGFFEKLDISSVLSGVLPENIKSKILSQQEHLGGVNIEQWIDTVFLRGMLMNSQFQHTTNNSLPYRMIAVDPSRIPFFTNVINPTRIRIDPAENAIAKWWNYGVEQDEFYSLFHATLPAIDWDQLETDFGIVTPNAVPRAKKLDEDLEINQLLLHAEQADNVLANSSREKEDLVLQGLHHRQNRYRFDDPRGAILRRQRNIYRLKKIKAHINVQNSILNENYADVNDDAEMPEGGKYKPQDNPALQQLLKLHFGDSIGGGSGKKVDWSKEFDYDEQLDDAFEVDDPFADYVEDENDRSRLNPLSEASQIASGRKNPRMQTYSQNFMNHHLIDMIKASAPRLEDALMVPLSHYGIKTVESYKRDRNANKEQDLYKQQDEELKDLLSKIPKERIADIMNAELAEYYKYFQETLGEAGVEKLNQSMEKYSGRLAELIKMPENQNKSVDELYSLLNQDINLEAQFQRAQKYKGLNMKEFGLKYQEEIAQRQKLNPQTTPLHIIDAETNRILSELKQENPDFELSPPQHPSEFHAQMEGEVETARDVGIDAIIKKYHPTDEAVGGEGSDENILSPDLVDQDGQRLILDGEDAGSSSHTKTGQTGQNSAKSAQSLFDSKQKREKLMDALDHAHALLDDPIRISQIDAEVDQIQADRRKHFERRDKDMGDALLGQLKESFDKAGPDGKFDLSGLPSEDVAQAMNPYLTHPEFNQIFSFLDSGVDKATGEEFSIYQNLKDSYEKDPRLKKLLDDFVTERKKKQEEAEKEAELDEKREAMPWAQNLLGFLKFLTTPTDPNLPKSLYPPNIPHSFPMETEIDKKLSPLDRAMLHNERREALAQIKQIKRLIGRVTPFLLDQGQSPHEVANVVNVLIRKVHRIEASLDEKTQSVYDRNQIEVPQDPFTAKRRQYRKKLEKLTKQSINNLGDGGNDDDGQIEGLGMEDEALQTDDEDILTPIISTDLIVRGDDRLRHYDEKEAEKFELQQSNRLYKEFSRVDEVGPTLPMIVDFQRAQLEAYTKSRTPPPTHEVAARADSSLDKNAIFNDPFVHGLTMISIMVKNELLRFVMTKLRSLYPHLRAPELELQFPSIPYTKFALDIANCNTVGKQYIFTGETLPLAVFTHVLQQLQKNVTLDKMLQESLAAAKKRDQMAETVMDSTAPIELGNNEMSGPVNSYAQIELLVNHLVSQKLTPLFDAKTPLQLFTIPRTTVSITIQGIQTPFHSSVFAKNLFTFDDPERYLLDDHDEYNARYKSPDLLEARGVEIANIDTKLKQSPHARFLEKIKSSQFDKDISSLEASQRHLHSLQDRDLSEDEARAARFQRLYDGSNDPYNTKERNKDVILSNLQHILPRPTINEKARRYIIGHYSSDILSNNIEELLDPLTSTLSSSSLKNKIPNEIFKSDPQFLQNITPKDSLRQNYVQKALSQLRQRFLSNYTGELILHDQIEGGISPASVIAHKIGQQLLSPVMWSNIQKHLMTHDIGQKQFVTFDQISQKTSLSKLHAENMRKNEFKQNLRQQLEQQILKGITSVDQAALGYDDSHLQMYTNQSPQEGGTPTLSKDGELTGTNTSKHVYPQNPLDIQARHTAGNNFGLPKDTEAKNKELLNSSHMGTQLLTQDSTSTPVFPELLDLGDRLKHHQEIMHKSLENSPHKQDEIRTHLNALHPVNRQRIQLLFAKLYSRALVEGSDDMIAAAEAEVKPKDVLKKFGGKSGEEIKKILERENQFRLIKSLEKRVESGTGGDPTELFSDELTSMRMQDLLFKLDERLKQRQEEKERMVKQEEERNLQRRQYLQAEKVKLQEEVARQKQLQEQKRQQQQQQQQPTKNHYDEIGNNTNPDDFKKVLPDLNPATEFAKLDASEQFMRRIEEIDQELSQVDPSSTQQDFDPDRVLSQIAQLKSMISQYPEILKANPQILKDIEEAESGLRFARVARSGPTPQTPPSSHSAPLTSKWTPAEGSNTLPASGISFDSPPQGTPDEEELPPITQEQREWLETFIRNNPDAAAKFRAENPDPTAEERHRQLDAQIAVLEDRIRSNQDMMKLVTNKSAMESVDPSKLPQEQVELFVAYELAQKLRKEHTSQHKPITQAEVVENPDFNPPSTNSTNSTSSNTTSSNTTSSNSTSSTSSSKSTRQDNNNDQDDGEELPDSQFREALLDRLKAKVSAPEKDPLAHVKPEQLRAARVPDHPLGFDDEDDAERYRDPEALAQTKIDFSEEVKDLAEEMVSKIILRNFHDAEEKIFKHEAVLHLRVKEQLDKAKLYRAQMVGLDEKDQVDGSITEHTSTLPDGTVVTDAVTISNDAVGTEKSLFGNISIEGNPNIKNPNDANRIEQGHYSALTRAMKDEIVSMLTRIEDVKNDGLNVEELKQYWKQMLAHNEKLAKQFGVPPQALRGPHAAYFHIQPGESFMEAYERQQSLIKQERDHLLDILEKYDISGEYSSTGLGHKPGKNKGKLNYDNLKNPKNGPEPYTTKEERLKKQERSLQEQHDDMVIDHLLADFASDDDSAQVLLTTEPQQNQSGVIHDRFRESKRSLREKYLRKYKDEYLRAQERQRRVRESLERFSWDSFDKVNIIEFGVDPTLTKLNKTLVQTMKRVTSLKDPLFDTYKHIRTNQRLKDNMGDPREGDPAQTDLLDRLRAEVHGEASANPLNSAQIINNINKNEPVQDQDRLEEERSLFGGKTLSEFDTLHSNSMDKANSLKRELLSDILGDDGQVRSFYTEDGRSLAEAAKTTPQMPIDPYSIDWDNLPMDSDGHVILPKDHLGNPIVKPDPRYLLDEGNLQLFKIYDHDVMYRVHPDTTEFDLVFWKEVYTPTFNGSKL
jgi:hypothetical protein